MQHTTRQQGNRTTVVLGVISYKWTARTHSRPEAGPGQHKRVEQQVNMHQGNKRRMWSSRTAQLGLEKATAHVPSALWTLLVPLGLTLLHVPRTGTKATRLVVKADVCIEPHQTKSPHNKAPEAHTYIHTQHPPPHTLTPNTQSKTR